jgi:hypothetical protein
MDNSTRAHDLASPTDMLQTDPAGRVVGLRVPAPWVGSATFMGPHGLGLKYLWGPDP